MSDRVPSEWGKAVPTTAQADALDLLAAHPLGRGWVFEIQAHTRRALRRRGWMLWDDLWLHITPAGREALARYREANP